MLSESSVPFNNKRRRNLPTFVLEYDSFYLLLYKSNTYICKEWVGAPVDPNDPRNTNVIHLMRRNVVDLRDGLAFSTEPHELLLLVFADLFLK